MAESNIDRNPRVAVLVASQLKDVVDSVTSQTYKNIGDYYPQDGESISTFFNNGLKLAKESGYKIVVFLNDENYFLTNDAVQKIVDKFVKEEYNIAGIYTDIKDMSNNLVQYLPSFNKEAFIMNRFALNNTLAINIDCLKEFSFNEEIKHLQLVQLFKFMVHRFNLTHCADTLIAHTQQNKDVNEDMKHI